MPEDWFVQNAPAPDPGGGDWFAANAPSEKKKSTPPQTWSEKLGMKGPILGGSWNPVKAQIDVTEGAVSGLASTAFKGGDLIRRGLGMKRVIDTPEAKQLMAAPPTVAGQVGHYGEQAAEFAIPMGGVARAVAKAPVLARMAVEGTAAGGIAGMQSGGDPAITGTAAAIGAIVPGLPAGWNIAKAGVKTGREALGRALLRNTTWKQAMVKGIRPAAQNLRFKTDLDLAMPDWREAEARTGKFIADSEAPTDALIENIKDAKKSIWSQIEGFLGPNAKRAIDLSPVADAQIAAIPSEIRVMNPEEYAKLVAEANKYRRSVTVQEAEEFLQTTNDKLAPYYAKYPGTRSIARGSNPETAALEAKADAIRDSLYKFLDATHGGDALRGLKQRYGAQINMLREAERRVVVAERQAPNSLSEQVGKWRGAGRALRGAYRATVGGDPLGGGADIADAITSTEAARALKETNTTNELLRHAFREFKGAPHPPVIPSSPPPLPAPYIPPGMVNVPPVPPAIPPVVGPGPLRRVGSPTAPYAAPGAANRPPAPPVQAPAVGPLPSAVVGPQQPPPPLVTPGPAQPLRAIEYQPPSPTMPPPLSTPGPPPAQMPPAMAAPPQPAPPAASPAPPPLATPRPTTIQTPQGTYTILGEEGGRVGVSFKNNKGIVSEYDMSVAEVERLVAKQR